MKKYKKLLNGEELNTIYDLNTALEENPRAMFMFRMNRSLPEMWYPNRQLDTTPEREIQASLQQYHEYSE